MAGFTIDRSTGPRQGRSGETLIYVQLAGPVAIFTTNGQLGHWGILVDRVSAQLRLRSAYMATHAVCLDGKIEGHISHFEVRRESPRFSWRCSMKVVLQTGIRLDEPPE